MPSRIPTSSRQSFRLPPMPRTRSERRVNAVMDESIKSRHYPDTFNWWELEEQCSKCTQPLHMASGQDVAFCPNCLIDQKNAFNGRTALAVAKARELKERLLLEEEKKLRGDDDDGPRGAFRSGMTL